MVTSISTLHLYTFNSNYNMEMNIMDILKEIKQKGLNNEEFSIDLKKMKIPLTIKDRKAIQIIELLTCDEELDNPTNSDILDILHHTGTWLELLQILNHCER